MDKYEKSIEERAPVVEGTDKIGSLMNCDFIQLTDSKKIAVRLVWYNNKEFLDIRHWVRFRGHTDYFPTKRGVFIEVRLLKDKLLPILKRLIPHLFSNLP